MAYVAAALQYVARMKIMAQRGIISGSSVAASSGMAYQHENSEKKNGMA